jgi:hypothetical protein
MPASHLYTESRLNAIADKQAEELERSENGPKFESVTPEQLFSSKSDGALAYRVLRSNPQRYRELRTQWEYISGQREWPDSHYSE